MEDPSAVVVADDVTGATDTGSQFARRGHRTDVVFDPSDSDTGDVLVVDTETRMSPPDEAYEAVRAVVERFDPALLYKKVDSTLRGNVAEELRALLDGADPDVLLVAPAFPPNGRTTEDGRQLIHGEPVTDALTDSENLPSSSRVADLLSSLPHDLETIPLTIVRNGTEAVTSKLASIRGRSDPPVVVVADANTRSHLRSLADASHAIEADVAYAGSGGLAGELSIRRAEHGERSVLGVVGSVSETAFSQLAAVPDGATVPLDPATVIEDPERAASAAVDPLLDAQRRHGFAVVTSATSSADVEATGRNADRLGIGRNRAEYRVVTALKLAVRGVHESNPLTGLVTTGGATTVAVLDGLDAESLELTGIELADGVPVTRVRDGAVEGTLLVTKAGSFGDPTTIVTCLEFVGEH